MDPLNDNQEHNDLVAQVIDQSLATMQAVNQRPEIAIQAAVAYRQFFKALTFEGFTDEQAIAIISRQGAVKLG